MADGPDFPAPPAPTPPAPANGRGDLRELVDQVVAIELVDVSRPGRPRFTIGGRVYTSDDPWADACAQEVAAYFRTSNVDELRVTVVEENGQVGLKPAPA